MAIKKDSSDFGDEDFQFHGEEPPHPEMEEKPPRRGISSILKSRLFWIIVILVIVAIIVYQFMSGGEGAIKEEVKPIVREISQPTLQQASSIKAEPLVTNLTEAQDEIQAKLADAVKQNAEQINQLQNSLQQLQTTVGQLGRQINNVNNSVNTLQTQVGILTNPPPPVTKTPPVYVPPKPTAPPVIYTLRSVLPGRAWLLGNNGKLKTVTIGNSLAGYGVVQKIDVARGMVWMSGGRVITYGPNDR